MVQNFPIYLDYHSTTPVDPRVAQLILHYMADEFGNASSVDHEYGDRTEVAVNQAARHVADLVEASPKEIIWTSGATESINLAIQGTVATLGKTTMEPSSWIHQIVLIIKRIFFPNRGITCPRIAVSPVEHKAVLATCHALEKRGKAELIYLRVDFKGRLDLDYLEQVCAEGLSLVCVMAANNEIGNIYPIGAIAQIAQRYSIPFLCDASQAVGKIPINFEEWGITYLAISAHKLYGPKGCGALVVRKGQHLEPIIFGGGHQKGMRSGTLDVPSIVGLGEACRLRQLEMEEDEKAIAFKRDKLQNLLLDKIPGLVINGDTTSRLAGNLHISIPDIPNSAVIARVRSHLAISASSACSSGVETPSHVLQALGLPTNVIEGALRIGLGKSTTDEEIDRAAEILSTVVSKTRQTMLT